MASFTEYVKLILEDGETIAAINRVNAAINKLREQAEKPINIKVNTEIGKIEGEKKLRAEKEKTNTTEHKNIQQRLADYKALKAMNAEQGNPSHTLKFGSPRSLEQGQRFNEQLSETTKRINDVADAHKHVALAAKMAGVEVSRTTASTLANQTVNRADKYIQDEIKEQEKLNNLKVKAMALTDKIRQNSNALDASAGGKAQVEIDNEIKRVAAVSGKSQVDIANEMKKVAADSAKAQESYYRQIQQQAAESAAAQIGYEKEIAAVAKESGKAQIAGIRERETQEEEGAKRLIAINKEVERAAQQAETKRISMIRQRESEEEEGAKRQIAYHNENKRLASEGARAQIQIEKEVAKQNELPSANKTGWRGAAGEWVRDLRRSAAYGTINQGEKIADAAVSAVVSRSRANEILYETGRTPEEMTDVKTRGRAISDKYNVMSQTAGMTLEGHAIGEVGTIKGGEELADIAAPFVSLMTAKYGAEAALSMNQKIMKGLNEAGYVGDKSKETMAYNQLTKMSQVEQENFDPGKWVTLIRNMKGAKFAGSDEMILKMAPLISIGESEGRTGNEYAMLFKTLAFSGKALDNSVGKTNHQDYINSTVLTDHKSGFNPELGRDLAAGTIEGVRAFNALLNKAAIQKGVDVNNALDFKQFLTHVFANQSAQELAMYFHEKPDFIEKQLGQYQRAPGLAAAQGIESRDISTAWVALNEKANDLAANAFEPLTKTIAGIINAGTTFEKWADKNPITAGVGIGVGAAAGIGGYVMANPGQAANTAALGVNTLALYANTGVRGAETLAGAAGTAGALAPIATAIETTLGKTGGAITAWGAALGLITYAGVKVNDYLVKDTALRVLQDRLRKQQAADLASIDKSEEHEHEAKRGVVSMADTGPFKFSPDGTKGYAKSNNMIPNYYDKPIGPNLPIYDYSPKAKILGMNPIDPNDPKTLPQRASRQSVYGDAWSGNLRPVPPFPSPGTHEDKQLDIKGPSFSTFIKTLEDAGSSAGATIKTAGSELEGAGSSIVHALQGIAAEISGVKMPTQAGSAIPNVGKNMPGRL